MKHITSSERHSLFAIPASAVKRRSGDQILTLQLAGGSGQLGTEFVIRSIDIVHR